MFKKLSFFVAILSLLFAGHSLLADYDFTKLKNFSYDLERRPPALPPFMACYNKDGRQLCYIASNHGSDTNSPTFNLIRNAFDDFKPNFVVLEGFETMKGNSPSDIVAFASRVCQGGSSVCEEPAFGVSLAQKNGIAFKGGEPDDRIVFDALRSHGYTSNEAFAFYFSILVPQLYRSQLVNSIGDVQQKFEVYKKNNTNSGVTLSWSEYLDWLKNNTNKSVGFSEMIDPLFAAPISNGTNLQKLANKVEWIRDRNILRVILDAFNQYNRVLVIYGHSHYLTQIDVLEQYMGKPQFVERYKAQ